MMPRKRLAALGVLAGSILSFAIMPGLQLAFPASRWVEFDLGGASLSISPETNCPVLSLRRQIWSSAQAQWTIQPYRLVGGEWSAAGYSERSGFIEYDVTDSPGFSAPLAFWRGDTPVNCATLEGTYRVEVTVRILPVFFRPRPVRLVSSPITYEAPS